VPVEWVEAVAPGGGGPGTPVVPEPPPHGRFVGRGPALSQLRDCLQTTVRYQRQIVFVTGQGRDSRSVSGNSAPPLSVSRGVPSNMVVSGKSPSSSRSE
jgi:hypothetical protein